MAGPSHPGAPARILILGGGFAGAYCAQRLERLLRPEQARITLIDRNNYFPFYPFLVEAGTGALEPRHAVVSIRAFLRRSHFVMGEVTGGGLAPGDGQEPWIEIRPVESAEAQRLPFDHLVFALGSVNQIPPESSIPGVRAHTLPIKTLQEAIALRDRAIRMLEAASATTDPARRRRFLHFVVVGANFTGAEVAGELEGFLREALAREYPSIAPGDIRITLIDRGDRILSALDARLGEYAADQLRRRGVRILLNESIARVEADQVTLTGGGILDTSTVIWAAGIAPPPAAAALSLPADERGYILCERDLRVRGHQNIWGIGDAAVNPDAEGRPYPATAQLAIKQGRWCADNIARVLDRRPALPCDLREQGSLAALGRRTGVASIRGRLIAGFFAWWLWRTVYLFKMPGFKRKVRIALEWTLDLFFQRDLVQIGGREHARPGSPPAASG
jgi:NADH:ubiquinone reductase (H+-translocating)